jgi:hypothetical protein
MGKLTAADFVSCGSLALSEIRAIEAAPFALYAGSSTEAVPSQMNVGYAEVASKDFSLGTLGNAIDGASGGISADSYGSIALRTDS